MSCLFFSGEGRAFSNLLRQACRQGGNETRVPFTPGRQGKRWGWFFCRDTSWLLESGGAGHHRNGISFGGGTPSPRRIRGV